MPVAYRVLRGPTRDASGNPEVASEGRAVLAGPRGRPYPDSAGPVRSEFHPVAEVR